MSKAQFATSFCYKICCQLSIATRSKKASICYSISDISIWIKYSTVKWMENCIYSLQLRFASAMQIDYFLLFKYIQLEIHLSKLLCFVILNLHRKFVDVSIFHWILFQFAFVCRSEIKQFVLFNCWHIISHNHKLISLMTLKWFFHGFSSWIKYGFEIKVYKICACFF